VSWILDRLAWLHAPWTDLSDVQAELARHEMELLALRSAMSSAENLAYERAAQLVGLIKAEFVSLREQLDASAQALEGDAQADADRLNGLLDELATVVPAEVPEVPTPAPGEPAELPSEPVDGDQPA